MSETVEKFNVLRGEGTSHTCFVSLRIGQGARPVAFKWLKKDLSVGCKMHCLQDRRRYIHGRTCCNISTEWMTFPCNCFATNQSDSEMYNVRRKAAAINEFGTNQLWFAPDDDYKLCIYYFSTSHFD